MQTNGLHEVSMEVLLHGRALPAFVTLWYVVQQLLQHDNELVASRTGLLLHTIKHGIDVCFDMFIFQFQQGFLFVYLIGSDD